MFKLRQRDLERRRDTGDAGQGLSGCDHPVGEPRRGRRLYWARGALLLLGAALLTVTWAQRAPEEPGSEAVGRGRTAGASDETRLPNPWFYLERAYPLGHIPLDQWRTAQAQATALRAGTRRTGVPWTPRGPDNIGGRITDLAVDPRDDDVVFAGSAEGGVLRTTDGGQTWTMLFDDMPSLAVGAVALDPSNPDVVWAGTGEVNPGGGSVAYGGVWAVPFDRPGEQLVVRRPRRRAARSAASGSTRPTLTGSSWPRWASCGKPTRNGGSTAPPTAARPGSRCSTLTTRPAASTSSSAPTTRTWSFAAMWRRIRQPEFYGYGGSTCAIHRSTDGGDTWAVVGGGLPAPSASSGRIGISLCQSNPTSCTRSTPTTSATSPGSTAPPTAASSWARTNDAALTRRGLRLLRVVVRQRAHPPLEPGLDLRPRPGLSTAAPTAGRRTSTPAATCTSTSTRLEFGPGGEPDDLPRQRRRRVPLDRRRRRLDQVAPHADHPGLPHRPRRQQPGRPLRRGRRTPARCAPSPAPPTTGRGLRRRRLPGRWSTPEPELDLGAVPVRLHRTTPPTAVRPGSARPSGSRPPTATTGTRPWSRTPPTPTAATSGPTRSTAAPAPGAGPRSAPTSPAGRTSAPAGRWTGP